MSNVFVIINEWTVNEGATLSEVVDAKFFRTEQDAWDSLKLIADSYHTELLPDETSIYLEDHSQHLQYEEYYIQELAEGKSA